MAGRMNRFGCTAADVVDIFKTGSYSPTSADFGGDAAIERFIDMVCDEIIQNMPEQMFLALSDVELEKVETRATANQATVTLTLHPVIAGKTHIWKGQPRNFRQKPRLNTDIDIAEGFADPELTPANELDSTKFTVDASTGVVTFTAGNLLATNDEVYATYQVNVASLSVPSLASIAAEGAAYFVGSKHYARGTSQWQFIDQLEESYTGKIRSLRDGEWLPPETRLMRFWEERTPEEDKKSTIQRGRLVRG